jgi:hypothetical protein
MSKNTQPTTIGRAEPIQLLDQGGLTIIAKVDTGADLSSIWVSEVVETAEGLTFVLFEAGHPEYSGDVIKVAPGEYSKARIANSFGQREIRYTVKLRIKLAGRSIRATFSLANRKDKLYPVLLGRRLLKGKFIVDVSKGDPLHKQEKVRKQKLLRELDKSDDRLGA